MTLLMTGFFVVIMMVIGMGAAVTSVHLDRASLQYAADAAALTAGSGVVADGFYGAGDSAISQRAAREAVERSLADNGNFSGRISDISATEVSVHSDGTVTVRVSARTRPPLTHWFMDGEAITIPLAVEGKARAAG